MADIATARAAQGPTNGEPFEAMRRLYEAALSNTPDFIYIFGLDCRVKYANRSLLQTWGRELDEAVGKTLLELGYEPWQAQRHEAEIREVAASGKAFRGQVPFTGTEGRRVYDYIFAPIFNAAGEVEAITGMGRDITADLAAKEAQEEQETRFRILADNIAQFAWMADPTGKIFWLNERWHEEIGLSLDRIEAGESALHPEHRDRVRAKFLTHMRSGAEWDDIFPMRCKDGIHRWYLSRAKPIRDREGNIVRWFGTNTDITDLKAAEVALSENRERLQAALQAARAGTFRWDIQTNAIDWDDALDRLFGLPPGNSARSLAQFVYMVHPDDRAEVIARCERCAAEGTEFDMEFRVVWPDGSIHWLHDHGETFKDENGKPLYMTGACVEITSRKFAELQNQLQRETLEQILRGDSLESILGGLTAHVEQTIARPLIATILVVEPDGVTMRSIAGQRSPAGWTEYLRGFTIGPDVGSCGAAAWSGQRIVVEDVASDPRWEKHRDEALKHNLRACWSTPILSAEKKVLGTFAIYYPQPGIPTDAELALVDLLTRTASIAIERKTSEAALEEARQKLARHAETLESKVAERTASLQDAVSQMEEFSYTVSHDLRAPLRGMLVYSKALQEDFNGALPEEARRFVSKISENAHRLDRMILDVLTFSRISRASVALGPVDLNEFMRNLVEDYEWLQPHKSRLHIDVLPPVIAHEPSLTQAVSNLLNNAVKFVAPGVTPEVRLRCERRGRNVRLWIADNGIGIPPELHPRLFQMFERLHPNLPYEGTGVGLAIVRKAIERMGGTCGMECDGARGSRFWIELKGIDA